MLTCLRFLSVWFPFLDISSYSDIFSSGSAFCGFPQLAFWRRGLPVICSVSLLSRPPGWFLASCRSLPRRVPPLSSVPARSSVLPFVSALPSCPPFPSSVPPLSSVSNFPTSEWDYKACTEIAPIDPQNLSNLNQVYSESLTTLIFRSGLIQSTRFFTGGPAVGHGALLDSLLIWIYWFYRVDRVVEANVLSRATMI